VPLKEISIESVNDLIRCLNLSSLLEISGWPKPGNVHRTKNFKDTKFEHFLAGTAAILPNFRELCSQVFDNYEMNKENYSYVNLGLFFKYTAKNMMAWQSGGNVLLGHILILAPLASAAAICLKTNMRTYKDFTLNLKKVIDDSTIEDTINLYEAMRICNPGGLGKIEKYDINDDQSFSQIREDKITLKQIFEMSKSYDQISNEYATGFNIILNEGLPYFQNKFEQYNEINIATVNTYLYLLSIHPDTLLIRKSGKLIAESVSNNALKILEQGGISSNKGLKLALKLDRILQKKNGKLNPGTTADLLAGVIFCALLFGLRF